MSKKNKSKKNKSFLVASAVHSVVKDQQEGLFNDLHNPEFAQMAKLVGISDETISEWQGRMAGMLYNTNEALQEDEE